MKFKKIKHYIILLVMFFSCVHFVNASVFINEIKIAPTEDRFIELYNNGGSSVDLTDWYIQRKTATGSDFSSLVSKTYFNGKSIKAGGYFVISRGDISNTDIVYPSLTLKESNTIQLKNSSQEVVDKVGFGDATDCGGDCAPNPTEGKSIQRNSSGSWSVSSATVGVSNTSTGSSDNSSDDDVDEENNSSDSTVLFTSTKKEDPEILKVTTKIISPKVAVAGIPFALDSLTTTNQGKTYMVGKFIWNFGDGNKMEVNKVAPFDYIYDYPGEYALSLSYFDNSFTEVPDAVSKMIIKVVSSDISINSVGSYTDPYIELENKSSYDMDISNWVINASVNNFIIPKGTTILKGNKLKLSPRITGFTGGDMSYVNITNPSLDMIATYPLEKKRVIKSISSSNNSSYIEKVKTNDNLGDNTEIIKDSNVINLNDLSASAGNSKTDISNSAYSLIGLAVVIGIGLASFILLKKSKKVDDYMDGEVRAEDIKILE